MKRALVEVERNINSVMARKDKTINYFKLLFIGIIIFTGFQTQAQQVYEEPAISALKSHFRSYYAQNETIRGYRIQINSTTDRREMERELRRFKNLYPSMFNEWKHTAPYYRIIVGAFLTKKEAQEKIHAMRHEFSSCILVFDDITKDQLLN